MENENMQDEWSFEKPTSNFQPCEAGTYELRIEEAKKVTGNKNYINLTIVVRDDIDQPFAKTKFWDKIWENTVYKNTSTGKNIKKEAYEALDDAAKQGYAVKLEYDKYRIGKFVYAQDIDEKIIEDGVEKPNPDYQTTFPGGVDEVVQFLNGLCFQAKVNKTYNDYRGKDENTLDFTSIKRTTVHYEGPETPQTPSEPQGMKEIQIDDNDLPF